MIKTVTPEDLVIFKLETSLNHHTPDPNGDEDVLFPRAEPFLPEWHREKENDFHKVRAT